MRSLHIFLLTFALITMARKIHAEDFFSSWTKELTNGRILKDDDDLLVVQVFEDTISLKSLKYYFVKGCNISLSSEHRLRGFVKSMVSLGNGKIVLAHYDFAGVGRVSKWRLYVIDSMKCTYKAIERKLKGKSSGTLGEIATIIPYHNTFDVFASTLGNCSPCRYDDEGNSIEVPYNLNRGIRSLPGQDERQDDRKYAIQPIKDNDASEGYFFAFRSSECQTLLRIFDRDFGLLRQEYFDYAVHTFETVGDKIWICYTRLCLEDTVSNLTCDLLDFPLLNEHLSLTFDDQHYSVERSKLKRFPDGSVLLTLFNDKKCLEGSVSKESVEIDVRRIGLDGRVDRPFAFGNTSCMRPRDEIESFMLNNGEFCSALYECCPASPQEARKTLVKCTVPLMIPRSGIGFKPFSFARF